MRNSLSKEWMFSYISVFVTAVLVFALPKIFLEHFSIANITFNVVRAPEMVFAGRWIHFVTMFVLFEVVGIYIVVYGWKIRSQFLTVSQRWVVYGAELVTLMAGTGLLFYDFIFKKTMAGSNMIGVGIMEQALSGYIVFVTQQSAYLMLSNMHIIFTTAAAIYATTAISNYIICSIFECELSEVAVEARRDAYYRTLYASTALLTVGVLQLAAWLGLPTDSIVEKEEFTRLVTSITIYLSVLFTLMAIVSALFSAFSFNESVNKSHLDPTVKKELQINLFDRTMLISVFLPAIAGYLIKIVPLLFA
jgi:hypothetical protein